jgi:hypothetical protein
LRRGRKNDAAAGKIIQRQILNCMATKETTARIKINKLLEAAG